MRVAHLFHAYLYNTENWCYRLVAHLKGIDIVVVTDTIFNTASFPLPAAKFSTPMLAGHISPDSGFFIRLMRFILRWFWLHFTCIHDLEQTNLLHAHFATMGWNYLFLRRKLSIPLIISFYGYDYEWLPLNHPEWQMRYQVLFNEADHFLVEGSVGREKLLRMGCPESKVSIARLGVNVKNIPFVLRPKKKYYLRLVQVASFTEKKGHITTVRAFARVAAILPNVELTLVGPDPNGMQVELEKIIAEFDVVDRITFTAGVDFAELHEFLMDFHVFIHPSRHSETGDSEGGAPIVLLDAQATGMPVLATNHCDIPDEVIHEVTGLLVDEDDHVRLAEAIGRFYRMDEEEYHRFSKNARRHVEDNYDVIKCAEKLREIYLDVIAAN